MPLGPDQHGRLLKHGRSGLFKQQERQQQLSAGDVVLFNSGVSAYELAHSADCWRSGGMQCGTADVKPLAAKAAAAASTSRAAAASPSPQIPAAPFSIPHGQAAVPFKNIDQNQQQLHSGLQVPATGHAGNQTAATGDAVIRVCKDLDVGVVHPSDFMQQLKVTDPAAPENHELRSSEAAAASTGLDSTAEPLDLNAKTEQPVQQQNDGQPQPPGSDAAVKPVTGDDARAKTAAVMHADIQHQQQLLRRKLGDILFADYDDVTFLAVVSNTLLELGQLQEDEALKIHEVIVSAGHQGDKSVLQSLCDRCKFICGAGARQQLRFMSHHTSQLLKAARESAG